MSPGALSVQRHFADLPDPRRRHGQLHRSLDILVIALCAVIAGANTWPEVETFARRRRGWLARFLGLPNGVPSHDTFERVFDRRAGSPPSPTAPASAPSLLTARRRGGRGARHAASRRYTW
jgi:hypothetical protein